MTITLGEPLKDSAYKLTQISEAKIQALEANIITKDGLVKLQRISPVWCETKK